MSLFDLVAPYFVLACGVLALVLLVGAVVFYWWEERRERRLAAPAPAPEFSAWRGEWEWSE